jgi:hypothetical protein
MYVNGGIVNEHNDQDISTGLPSGCRVDVYFERYLDHVTDISSRLDEKKTADQALVEKFIALKSSRWSGPILSRQPFQVVGLFFSVNLGCMPATVIINTGSGLLN